MCTLFCMKICLWGSCCQSGCRVFSRWIRKDNVSLIPRAVWSCFGEINRIFFVGMWQWTKPGSITTLRSRSGRQPSGLQSIRSVQSGLKPQMWTGKVMASVFWDAHGVLFIDYLEKGKTINSECYIGQLMRLKNEIGEKRLQMKKKKVLFHQDNAPCHKSGPQRLLSVCRPRKNAPRKEILLQWGSHHRNERLFRG